MNASYRYKKRDYTFGLVLLTLREKVGLTQSTVVSQTGISEKALRNWESGSNYPKEEHLRTLIEFYLKREAFSSGKEHDEALALWELMTRNSSRRKAIFDETWFSMLLTYYYQHRNTHS